MFVLKLAVSHKTTTKIFLGESQSSRAMAPISKCSKVWKYFSKCEGGAKCKICQRYVKTTGNTTNLIAHIKRNHHGIFDGIDLSSATLSQSQTQTPTEDAEGISDRDDNEVSSLLNLSNLVMLL